MPDSISKTFGVIDNGISSIFDTVVKASDTANEKRTTWKVTKSPYRMATYGMYSVNSAELF